MQTQKKQPHVHSELIKQWADGAEVQFWEQGEWQDCKVPFWFPDMQYRIKPEPTDVEKYGIEVGDIWQAGKYVIVITGIVSNDEYRGNVQIKSFNDSYSKEYLNDLALLVFRKGVVNLL